MATIELLAIEVVYALPEQQTLLTVKLPAGSTVAQAIEQSGVLARHPELDLSLHKVGIFAKVTALDTVLRDHDRAALATHSRPLLDEGCRAHTATMSSGIGT